MRSIRAHRASPSTLVLMLGAKSEADMRTSEYFTRDLTGQITVKNIVRSPSKGGCFRWFRGTTFIFLQSRGKTGITCQPQWIFQDRIGFLTGRSPGTR